MNIIEYIICSKKHTEHFDGVHHDIAMILIQEAIFEVREFSNGVIPCITGVVSNLIATLGTETMLVNQMTEH